MSGADKKRDCPVVEKVDVRHLAITCQLGLQVLVEIQVVSMEATEPYAFGRSRHLSRGGRAWHVSGTGLAVQTQKT